MSPYDEKPECGQRLHPGPVEFWCARLHDWLPVSGLECQRCKAGQPVRVQDYRDSLRKGKP